MDFEKALIETTQMGLQPFKAKQLEALKVLWQEIILSSPCLLTTENGKWHISYTTC